VSPRRGAPRGAIGRLLRRLVRAGVAALAVALLAAAGYGFVLKSLPYHTPQLSPPRIRLTVEEAARLDRYPGGVRGVPVLSWRDVSYRPGNLVTTPVRFASELAVLREEGFRSLRLGTLAAVAAGRRVSLPARPIVLTFDDGLATDWTTVDPILRQYGFTAVVFIHPQDVAVKSPSYFLTHDELRAMAASGRWQVGLQLSERQLPPPAATRQAAGGRAADGQEQAQIAPAIESAGKWRQRTLATAAREQSELAGIVGSPVTAYGWPVAITPDPRDLQAPQVIYPVLRPSFDVGFGRPAVGPAAFVVAGSARRPLRRLNITAGSTLRVLSASLRTGVPGPPPANPLTLPWHTAHGRCARTGTALTLRGHGFVLCTVAADGSEWRGYELRLRASFARSADLTAIIELRLSTAGRIEVAIGRSGVSVKQLVRRRWSLLRTDAAKRPIGPDGVTLSFLRAGTLPVRLRIAGTLLRVQVGSVTTEIRVSPALRHGVIAVGLVSPARRQAVTYRRLRLVRVAAQPAAR
jgi:poly-beta-1,6-N-acetyl-D-glucosamine N-deacetylase